jgi:molybdopterin adenylyltransferase
MDQLKIVSVNISENKGTVKNAVKTIELFDLGIKGDAHSGNWHRQISLLGNESLLKMTEKTGRPLNYGELAENITTEGFPVYNLHVFDRLISGKVELEITQIGKKCHGGKCAIFRETGDCLMPTEGIFGRVISGGKLKAGDSLVHKPKIFKILIITLSDRASRGEYEDKSGPVLKQLTQDFFNISGRKAEIENIIIPDEVNQLNKILQQYINNTTDIIFTTGGTGIGPRDITPEVVKPLLDKEIPGIMEMIRFKYGTMFPNALISRSIAGVAGKTLIYALPGNPKAVIEYADEIFKTVDHSFRMIHNIDSH